MTRRRVAALVERHRGERRVALVPEATAVLAKLGFDLVIEAGAGDAASFPDDAYLAAGASVVGRDEARHADIVVTCSAADADLAAELRPGSWLVGLLSLLSRPEVAEALAARDVNAASLDLLPRTISRAQSMDALSSQANIAGYKAVLVAADHFTRMFPLLITAAGTAKPADVLVLGAGVAGLQAMGTARRLGAVVTGYDVRPETEAEIASVGARFLKLKTALVASGDGGYARALSDEERAAQTAELNDVVPRFDVVITTAQVPGRRPPQLVSAAAVEAMRPGSVLVDLAASELGGNVEGSVPFETVTTKAGALLIGGTNLASAVPNAASRAFSNNVCALLTSLCRDGAVHVDADDEVHTGVVVVRDGAVVHPGVAGQLGAS